MPAGHAPLIRRASAALAATLLVGAAAGAVAQEASLPGGASALTESFGDWTVSCRIVENVKHCMLSQQALQQNGQRLWAIEMVPGPDGRLTGALGLPFGLRLGDGTRLAIDDQPPGAALPFSTCLPVGCIVPLDLDAATVAALRTGSSLTLGTTADDTGAAISLQVSLQGFGSGLDRTVALLD